MEECRIGGIMTFRIMLRSKLTSRVQLVLILTCSDGMADIDCRQSYRRSGRMGHWRCNQVCESSFWFLTSLCSFGQDGMWWTCLIPQIGYVYYDWRIYWECRANLKRQRYLGNFRESCSGWEHVLEKRWNGEREQSEENERIYI